MKVGRISRDSFSTADKMLFKLRAWKKGKPVKLTIENSDKKATNERMIRVDAKHVWGDPQRKAKPVNPKVQKDEADF